MEAELSIFCAMVSQSKPGSVASAHIFGCGLGFYVDTADCRDSQEWCKVSAKVAVYSDYIAA